MPVQRQFAYLESGYETLQCQFNPSEMVRTETAQWSNPSRPAAPTTGSTATPSTPQYTGSGSATFSVTILFDQFDHPDRPRQDVAEALEILLSWTSIPDPGQTKPTPAPTSGSTSSTPEHPQPPQVKFGWGEGMNVSGVITSLEIHYLRMNAAGIPLRAQVKLKLLILPDYIPAQNPTSGGPGGRRAATVSEGDSLPSLAYRYYGDPNLWRAIALTNDIIDPTRLASGTSLLIPSRSQAERLSAVGAGE